MEHKPSTFPIKTPSAVLILFFFLLYAVTQIYMYTGFISQSHTLSLLYLSALEGKKIKMERKVKGELQLNSLPRIHLKRQISFPDAILRFSNLTGHQLSLKTFNHLPGVELEKKTKQNIVIKYSKCYSIHKLYRKKTCLTDELEKAEQILSSWLSS